MKAAQSVIWDAYGQLRDEMERARRTIALYQQVLDAICETMPDTAKREWLAAKAKDVGSAWRHLDRLTHETTLVHKNVWS